MWKRRLVCDGNSESGKNLAASVKSDVELVSSRRLYCEIYSDPRIAFIGHCMIIIKIAANKTTFN